LITAAAQASPDRLAVADSGGATATFAQFDRQVQALSGWAAASGTPGDRIAVIADNCLAYAQLYYAVPRAGCILTLINQRLSAAEQVAQLAATEPVPHNQRADRREVVVPDDEVTLPVPWL
jgi:acyl-CoA synthetase (AMP-forming)/AMP-acid ligase II